MNDDLIRRGDLKNDVYRTVLEIADTPVSNDYASKLAIKMGELMMRKIDDAPSMDAVEVVRCKDCICRDQAFRCIALYYGFNPNDDWFCANGKKDAEAEG